MSVIRSGVTVQFGLLSISTAVHGAVAPEPSNRTVCTGHGSHEPVRVTMPITCPQCGRIDVHDTHKAREVGDRLIVLDDAALAKIKDSSPYQKTMALRPHPAAQVDLGTIPDGKVYYLAPQAGSERPYAVLAAFLAKHEELAFCTQWAPRTRVGMFRVAAITPAGKQPVLALHGRMAANRLREAPELPTEADATLLEMLERTMQAGRKQLITAFEVNEYLDDTEEQIAALLQLVPEVPKADATADALARMLAEVKPKRVRKPRAKLAAVPDQPASAESVPA